MEIQQQEKPTKFVRLLHKDKQVSGALHAITLASLHGYFGKIVIEQDKGYLLAHVDVLLPNRSSIVIPDLTYLAYSNPAITDPIIKGSPDLIAEITASWSYKQDTEKKFNLYAEAGIKEYWIISAEMRTVNVFTLDENGQYQPLCHAYREGKVFSKVIDGFELEIARLFHRMK